MPTVHLLDYVAGNVRSLVNAIEKVGYQVEWIRKPEDVPSAEVTVVPAPVKFPERRAVLHALQKFAKIEVFRKLDDHDASFISVASDNESASELIRRSPLEYQLATGDSKGSVRTFLTTNPSTEPILNSAADSQIDTESNIRVEGQDTQKDFKLHIFPAPDYIHSAAVRASPLHGPWTDGRRETIMSSLLKRSLPADVSADGLSDWESGGQDPDLDKSRLVEDLQSLSGTKTPFVEQLEPSLSHSSRFEPSLSESP
ncbi:hypothetical protein BN1723_014930 [Verticillium longisporum]|uniref:Glutamine amidotransferase domain-containing protein n=1 Tax=Verticillium longisporum TaxID=100787 RepID=A0A0G4MLC8_VERLO|nr:hypothetical protein BN1723_014930 [Verticillium longisporum]